VNLHYTRQAETDIDIAMGWYESQRQGLGGLGFEFLDCLEDTVNRILERPKIYSIKHKRLRCALIRKFPFSVFYSIEKTAIVVHAVFDNRLDPDKKP